MRKEQCEGAIVPLLDGAGLTLWQRSASFGALSSARNQGRLLCLGDHLPDGAVSSGAHRLQLSVALPHFPDGFGDLLAVEAFPGGGHRGLSLLPKLPSEKREKKKKPARNGSREKGGGVWTRSWCLARAGPFVRQRGGARGSSCGVYGTGS